MSDTSLSSASTISKTRERSQSLCYIIVVDNIDKTVSPRYMTIDKQRQSLHNFHAYAVMDRIDFCSLANDKPIADVSSLPLSTFLPDHNDCKELCHNYATLLGRELTQTVPYFRKVFADCIPKHIDHKYTKEMATKSAVVRNLCIIFVDISFIHPQVPLGVLPYNEQANEDMVQIMDNIHQYVPVIEQAEGETYLPAPFGGDQLTAARALTAKKSRVTSKGKGALRGLVPFCADWHAKVNYMEVSLLLSHTDTLIFLHV